MYIFKGVFLPKDKECGWRKSDSLCYQGQRGERMQSKGIGMGERTADSLNKQK